MVASTASSAATGAEASRAIDPARRAALLAAKLAALVAGRGGEFAPGDGFPGGAVGRISHPDGVQGAWILVDEDSRASLGGALAWVRREAADRLDLIVDDPAAAGTIARRAGFFRLPIAVWRTDGRRLVAVAPAPPPVPLPPPEAPGLEAVLTAAGLTLVADDGIVLGELAGLEVARIVHGPDGPELEVGVGRFDRQMGAMTHGDLAPADRVVRAVDIVARDRRAGASDHPFGRLVPERWLRAVLVAHPEVVGASELVAVGSAEPRRNLTETAVASAVGTATDGSPLVVSCSAGIDLDLVPAAADDRALHRPGAALLLAVPQRNAHPLTAELAATLVEPGSLHTVPDDWATLMS